MFLNRPLSSISSSLCSSSHIISAAHFSSGSFYCELQSGKNPTCDYSFSTSSTNTECLSLMFQTAERVLTARTEQFMTDLCLLECIQFGWLLIIILWSHSPPKWKCRFQSQMLNKDKTGTWYFSMFHLMILDHPD